MAQSIPHNQPLWCCDYSQNGRLVATAGTGKCIFIYSTGPPPKNMELRLRIQGMKALIKDLALLYLTLLQKKYFYHDLILHTSLDA